MIFNVVSQVNSEPKSQVFTSPSPTQAQNLKNNEARSPKNLGPLQLYFLHKRFNNRVSRPLETSIWKNSLMSLSMSFRAETFEVSRQKPSFKKEKSFWNISGPVLKTLRNCN